MYLNGIKIEWHNKTILELLIVNGINAKVVVVEVNGNIIKKNDFDSFILNENDCVEVVSFVGGG
ncbi:MAG: sulfur carrier protein ThiS [Clostridia bacterium]|nr:sulfur carrier protein ThiS [Clostridia bacterium]